MQIEAVIADAVARIKKCARAQLGVFFSQEYNQCDGCGKHHDSQYGKRNEPTDAPDPGTVFAGIVRQYTELFRTGDAFQRLSQLIGAGLRERFGKADVYGVRADKPLADQHAAAQQSITDSAGGIGRDDIRLPVLCLLCLRGILAVREVYEVIFGAFA